MAIDLGFMRETEESSNDRFIKIPAVIWERLNTYEKTQGLSPEQFILKSIQFSEKNKMYEWL